jgi:type IV secretion system protein VirB6
MNSLFTDLLRNIDAAILASFASAATGMSHYVLPIGVAMFGISILVWAIMVMEGSNQTPMNDWMSKLLKTLFIFAAAGQFYSSWISGPLFALPNELSAAVTGAVSSTSGLDALSGKLDGLIMGIAQGMVAAFKNWNFGGALMLIVSMVLVAIAGCLLEIACVFNMIYAKIGLALVLGMGPFFVMCLLWPQTKGYFTTWLNTVLYFVFLTVITTMIMVLFIAIADRFMTKLMEQVARSSGLTDNNAFNIGALIVAQMTGRPSPQAEQNVDAQLNILSLTIQMALIYLPMFFVALEMRTLVSSLTGGSGGSMGAGVMQMVKTVKSGGRM